jgi:putative oxidoreductase
VHLLAASFELYDPTGLNIGLLILRVVIGLTIIAHGYNHLWGGGKIEGTAGWFASMGLRPGILHAWTASIVELVAGVLLILGLLNPFAAAGIVGITVVAGITAHRGNGFFIFKPGQGWEYVLVLGAATLALGPMGPGQWSIDQVLGLDLSGWAGLAITAIGGIGGAFLLLAVFWRPKAVEG